MFKELKTEFLKQVKQKGLEQSFQACHVCYVVKQTLEKIYSDQIQILSQITIKQYKHNTIYIQSDSQLVKHEIHYKKSQILEEANKRLTTEQIQDLRFF